MIKSLNLGTIMAKEKLIRDTRALAIGFCSGVPTGLLLILALNISLDSGGKSSDALFSVTNNYGPTEELLLLREMVTNLSSQTSVTSAQAAPAPETIVKEIVLREWQSPAVVNVREGEDKGETIFGEVPRRLTPLGTGGFLFIQFGAYRSSSGSFGVVGLGMRSMQVAWRSPQFDCAWQSAAGDLVAGTATKYLVPDSLFPSQYVTLVVHCTFDRDVGSDGMGGLLRMVANHGYMDGTGLEDVSFVALTEKPGEYDASVFNAPYKYDYLYCGSPFFADYNGASFNPQRMREWISYHMKFFGPNSHFILYDSGGINKEVQKILDPWLKLGRITIMDIRQEARYDASMHNQFLVLNDCLYRAKSLAKWTFFFDIDEYLHFESSHIVSGTEGEARPPQEPDFQSFEDLMSYLEKLGRKATSVTFQQRPMDDTHCVAAGMDAAKLESLWMIEKLVFRRFVKTKDTIEWTHWMDHKYAIQAKYVLAVGVHDVAQVVEAPPETPYVDTWMWKTYENCGNCFDGDVLHYYHFHNTITFHDELCREIVELGIQQINVTGHRKFDNGTCWLDQTMAHGIVDSVKAFELQMIGPQHT